MATIEEITAEAKVARQNLADLETELQEEIDEIRFRAFKEGRPMTDAERATRNDRRAQKSEAREAYVALSFMTLQRLNQSEEVKQLTLKINEIDQGLVGDLDDLKKIERYADTAAKVADGLANIATNIAGIVAA
jgi:hypothetical protein